MPKPLALAARSFLMCAAIRFSSSPLAIVTDFEWSAIAMYWWPNFRAASKPFGVLTEKTDGATETLVRERTGNRSLVLFDSGDEVTVQAGDEGIRFLLVSGKPIEEPVAWHGPIVMNTQAELQQAFAELRSGTFIR